MKVAIFGGAFNPVHREHVNFVKAAVSELGLDKIIIMPTAVSPHKSGRPIADQWQRFETCRLAFACVKEAEVSNFELAKGGVSYSYLTCRHFAALYPDAQRYLIIGADMLESFPEWRNPASILNDCTLVACARTGAGNLERAKKRVEDAFNTKVETISYVGAAVSSTRVRTLAALGENFSQYVSPEVCQYIEESGLYALKNLWPVKSMLRPERWQHTVRVSVMCAKNAARAGITEVQAITMGALHDCAKYIDADDVRLKGLQIPADMPQPVVHQLTGAYIAEKIFNVTDPVVLSAIGCHATGKENMSPADMLLYLCDMLEEGRSFEGVEALRQIFKEDLTACMRAALEHQIKYLSSTGAPIDGRTAMAYNYITNK